MKNKASTKLFHLTKKQNAKSILEKGLLPEYTNGLRTRWATKTLPKRTWLTDNVSIPIRQAGSTFSEKDWIVLEIDSSQLDIQPHRTTCYEEGRNLDIPNEFVTFNEIPKKNIKVVDLSVLPHEYQYCYDKPIEH